MKSRTFVAPLAVSIVSLAVVLTGTFALGGCASGSALVTSSAPSITPEASVTILFDNATQSYVDVYLIGQQRQWRLGRVEAGVRAALRIPESALTAPGFVRLAVLDGAPLSLEPSRDPRALLTLAQPRSQLTAQRWTFSKFQFASLQIVGAPR